MRNTYYIGKNGKSSNFKQVKQPRYNAETEAAMQEVRDIMSGKKKIKKYSSADELFEELDAGDK